MPSTTPFLNSQIFSPISAVTDSLYGARVTDRAWESVGLSREVLDGPPLFLPYEIQCQFAEHVAHQIGAEHTGALIGCNLRYTDLNIYGDYVLQGPDLAAALRRSVKALPYLARDVEARIDVGPGYVKVIYDSGLRGTKGAQHISEGVVFYLIDLSRRFLGPEWCPLWVEMDLPGSHNVAILEDLYSAPVRLGADFPAIALPAGDLLAKNPNGTAANQELVCADLKTLVRFCPPQSTEEMCVEVLKLQLRAGVVSEDAVASRLAIGPRTLQRRLRKEGTSFREISGRVFQQRACQLLEETDHSTAEISHALGYRETNSFRRAFEGWTGLSPNQYRFYVRQSKAG